MMAVLLLLLVLSVLLSGCMFPAGGRFLEGTEVLEKGNKKLAVSVMAGGPLAAGDVGVRARIGVGNQQEVRVEASLQVPRPSGLVRLSWKRQINEYVAVVLGARSTAGFVYHPDDYAYSTNFGSDAAVILSTGIAKPYPSQRIRPYLGLRLGSEFKLWGGSQQSPLVALLPSISTGIIHAVNPSVRLSFEIGYVPLIGLFNDVHRDLDVARGEFVESITQAWDSMHSAYAGIGVEWGSQHRSNLERRESTLFDEQIRAADAAMSRADLDEAIGLYEQAMSLRGDTWIICNIAEAYRRKLEFSAARSAFLRCLELDPKAHYADSIRLILEELPKSIP